MKQLLIRNWWKYSFVLFLGFMLYSCKKEDTSFVKIYVRNQSEQLLPNAKVILIGDTRAVPPSIDYVDTLFSDNAGIATFDLEQYFDLSGKKVNVGYFDVLIKFGSEQTTGRVRAKRNVTVVETIYF
ncbi:MAG: hypothetical protein EP338_12870 [Bacteroidetes bacterium]|nr:MAG: hypothetical protein EP338_12870 [Bacteroidota bacterium]